MSKAKLTILGLENFMQANNDSLFANVVLPAEINREDAIDNIILRSGEFEVLYSDPYFMKDAISLWSRKHLRTFTKWSTALNIDYNPLENYDRMEEWTDSEKSHSTDHSEKTAASTNEGQEHVENSGTITDDSSTTNTGTVTDENTVENSGTVANGGTTVKTGSEKDETHAPDITNTVTNSRSAYDSESFSNDTKSVSVTDEVDTSNTKTYNSVTDTVNMTRTDNTKQETTNTRTDDTTQETLSTRTDATKHDTTNSQNGTNSELGDSTHSNDSNTIRVGRAHGNIGVTTSQQMLQSELDIARWNLYEQISDLFVSEFCIMVY